jgi:acetamidase/formamidase
VVSIRPGDTLRFQTLDAGWGTGKSFKDRIKRYPRGEKLDSGHALIGPIVVEGAKQGMTLALTFNEIVPGSYGFTAAGHYPNWQNRKLRLSQYEEVVLDWKLDGARREATCQIGDQSYTLALRPLMGIVGMPPEPTGIHSTWPPRFCGGNIDCKELVAGSTLYLPIPVDGAYLAIGDGMRYRETVMSAVRQLNVPWIWLMSRFTYSRKSRWRIPERIRRRTGLLLVSMKI